ncbi:MAG: FxLYD domain-containing protein, partial [Nitrososphaeraceae archaeon]
QIVNNSTAPVDDVRVNVQFYDPNGQLLLETSRFITQPSQTLQPGETIPFTILETLGFDQVGKHLVIAEANPVT